MKRVAVKEPVAEIVQPTVVATLTGVIVHAGGDASVVTNPLPVIVTVAPVALELGVSVIVGPVRMKVA